MFAAKDKYLCHTAVFSTGERFPVLLYKGTYQPVILATRYVVDECRDNKKAGTISRDIRVLKWFYEWCGTSGVELEERLRTGKLLTKAEITGFCRYLRSRRNELIVGSIGTTNHSTQDRLSILSPETFNSYISVIEAFLVWAAYEFTPVGTPENSIRETVAVSIQRIERSFRSVRQYGYTANKRRGLSREEIENLRKVVKPGGENNPFKKTVQFRNHLIFELLLATGIRRGELLKIKIKHLPIASKTTLSIVRAPDDKEDPRRIEPQVKTRPRELPLPKPLCVDLWRYVQKYRMRGDSTYLLTSMRGGVALGQGAVNFIFDHLTTRCIPYLKGRLSPHVLRHTFNELLLEEAMAYGLGEQQIKELQRYLNGWSEHSEMPSLYTRRVIEKQAMEIAERYQASLYVF